ncbi:MAG: hypothetical protein IJT26_08820 [Bacteroidales bacterium]|nr:hypothetical protein [Bacteroidales bacterium]
MATTKAKTNVVPIDQDETFVSLSMAKNLGDNDSVAIEEKLHTLYKIQQTDTKIDKIYLLRGELPLEVQDIEDEVEGLKTRIANAKEEIAAAETANTSSRAQIKECEESLAKYNAQRDNVKNNREYESISKEIEYMDLQKQFCEKKIREANLLIEEKKALVEETQKHLAMREEDLENKRKELETIIKETAKEEAQLVKQRDELVTKIDERMYIAYKKVRSNTKNKLAVVTVKRDACGGCFAKIPPQRQLDIASSKKIIVCEYCGRILVNSDFEKEDKE